MGSLRSLAKGRATCVPFRFEIYQDWIGYYCLDWDSVSSEDEKEARQNLRQGNNIFLISVACFKDVVAIPHKYDKFLVYAWKGQTWRKRGRISEVRKMINGKS